MKTYYTQEEVDKDIIDNVLAIKGDVTFEFHLKLEASLIIKSGNIEAWNIKARNIEARNIEAWNIEAWNIEAGDIKSGNIKAWNIKARDIEARNIEARNISFFAVCFAYTKFVCKSIKARRNNGKYFCLDSEVEIKN